jgi:hypothetical protein
MRWLLPGYAVRSRRIVAADLGYVGEIVFAGENADRQHALDSRVA